MTKQGSSNINIQDPFFYKLRKEEQLVHIFLISGKRLTGIIRRFDKFALSVETNGQEQLVYKHAIANITIAGEYDETTGDAS